MGQRRTYDTSGRRHQAALRRAAILDACRTTLEGAGYAGLTIRAVAERAAVSQETVYKTFGSKRQLVKALYDRELAGDDEPVPMAGRPAVRALIAEPDSRRKVAGYAHLARQVSERIGAIAAALAAGGPEAADLTAEADRERLAGVTAFVGHLAATGHLRPGLDPAAAADACWVLLSPQVYRLSTVDRGWTADAYEDWLCRMLVAALL
ncbi:helix-turn-helix domain-containing protein [Dactylosporangium sp. AC04546]|uniref:TetR/AcrR family transcriptional regulator n=1 Tax=Dactylosporangium sp. AC04546 TaxID=2862460 RepID=UPI002E7ABF6C|nr:helix-turn-helix domain-containing protein [Dactylosporangium sp. AC04546]WVK88497.1 helix-turn-helix domain-containing protein [Dactylosporangium sp. AC04546]